MIEGERVYLAELREEDLPKILSWNLDEELNQYIDSDLPTSPEECRKWYQALQSDRYAQSFGIYLYETNELIGEIELINITWRNGHAELRIRIGEKQYWNQGLGTEAVRIFLGYVYHQLKLERVYLRVYETNKRAIRCYRKAGFKFEGKLTKSRHVPRDQGSIILMRILRKEYLRKEKQWRRELGAQVS
ncbi:MAG: GNAT family N-acetyltransferase [Firmicutes bacterium]|nr:GNAT family N-acetyltransferase [Bacillota bacterium]